MACRAGRDAFTRTAAIYAARGQPRDTGTLRCGPPRDTGTLRCGPPRDTGTLRCARRGIRVHCAAARRGVRKRCAAAGRRAQVRCAVAGGSGRAQWQQSRVPQRGRRLCTPAAAGLKKISESQSKGARAYAARPRNWALRCFRRCRTAEKSGPLRVAGRLLSNVRRLRRSRPAGIPLCGAGEMTEADNHEAMYRDTKKDAYRAFRLFCARGSDI